MSQNNDQPKKEHASRRIDPVCGIDAGKLEHSYHYAHEGKAHYFCSTYCESRFKKNMAKYSGDPMISVRDVYKTYQMGDTEAKILRGVDLNIWTGDFVVIIGQSGSGKSTTLNMIGLLDRPTSGHIVLKGHDVDELEDDFRAELRSETFGFVFQQFNLIPWLTAYENITLPLIFAGGEISEEKIKSNFAKVGMAEQRLLHRPHELSGGEQQRVALLRALANDPEIIIADEPTGNLDSGTSNKILELLMDLNKAQGKTLVIVTHDSAIAEMADQVITIKDGVIIANHKSKANYAK
jgi:ABC-type lipoprotein export system ATPase subunit/YHS domain-containing protein